MIFKQNHHSFWCEICSKVSALIFALHTWSHHIINQSSLRAFVTEYAKNFSYNRESNKKERAQKNRKSQGKATPYCGKIPVESLAMEKMKSIYLDSRERPIKRRKPFLKSKLTLLLCFFALLRFSPTRPPVHWSGVRRATSYGSVCPQKFPDISNETEALQRMSKRRFEFLRTVWPALQDQSEDCLYLNIYVPSK